MNFEELKNLLKSLNQEQVEELKGLLNNEEVPQEQPKEEAPTIPNEESKEETEVTAKQPEEELPTQGTEVPQETEEQPKEEAPTEEQQAKVPTEEEQAKVPTEEEQAKVPTEEEQGTQNFDDIPPMQKGAEAVEDDSPVIADDGEELPIDNKQIIDGLNAKILALETENKALKQKIDGAFGYSSKISTPAKVNKLYDDCNDVHFHR